MTRELTASPGYVRRLEAEIERLRESCIQIALDKDVMIERLRAALQELTTEIEAHRQAGEAQCSYRNRSVTPGLPEPGRSG